SFSLFFPFRCRYVVHSYNFFLFPSTLGVTDAELTLSASSIQFLSHYGFDYNKFLKDGIPYMNELQEKILRQRLLEGSWKVCSALNMNVVKKAIDEVTCWIAAAKEGDTVILQDLSGMKQGAFLWALSGLVTSKHLGLLVFSSLYLCLHSCQEFISELCFSVPLWHSVFPWQGWLSGCLDKKSLLCSHWIPLRTSE
uniref:Uncharacterized protein n=1 Tax=Pavo cristatus TaxID=9049 RepID=A0A8C9FFL5_PAVCR